MPEIPVIPENAPFSLEQRLWLNGFLAGYFARMSVPAAGPVPPLAATPAPPLLIVYGSQTGSALNLAKRIGKEAAARGFAPRVMDAADHLKVDWQSASNLLVVTSTYGDGDMPDNAQGFWDWLQTEPASKLAHLQFAVLALGDLTYADFCGAGRKLDLKLEQLGAKRFFPRTDCDVDYDLPAKAWIDGALAALSGAGSPAHPNMIPAIASNGSAHPHTNGDSRATSSFSKTNPFPARLLRNLPLSKPGSAKEVRHYEISLEGSGLTYEPGDALGVLPTNCPDHVSNLLAAARCTGDEPVRVGEDDMPLREACSRHFDITKPSPELLAVIALRAPASQLTPLLGADRREDLKQWLWGRGVIDLLHLLPEPLPAAELASLLRKLAPRLYSIASSPKAHPDTVHLTVNAVRYESHGRPRKGVASTFLADRVGEQDYVKVFVQPSHGFKPPGSGDTPMIMVGPGTGIAPFRAFLEERLATGAKGRHWLFFGEQKRDTDFLYEEQLTTWLKDGHLTRLDLAFSRDQADKIYVQHRMLENAAELWSWLQDGAHFYVCGDASRMAKDVDATLHRIAETIGGQPPEEAKAWVANLKAEKRYQRDVY